MVSKTLILIHASGMSSDQWRPFIRPLERHGCSVVRPSLTGYGDVPAPDPGASVIEADTRRVRAAIEATPGPIHLVGHSYGGYLALQAALEDPGRLTRLSLFEPVAFGVLHQRQHEDGLKDIRSWRETEGFFDPTIGGSPRWLKWFVDYWSGAGSYERMLPSTRHDMEAHGTKIFREVMECCADEVPLEAYAGLDLPVDLMAGAKTTRASRGVVTLLADTIPGASLTWVPGAGHMFPLSRPAAVIEHLLGPSPVPGDQ